MRLVWVGVLGSVGALARYELSRAIHHRTERGGVATMVVNVIGATLLGWLVGIDAQSPMETDLMAAMTVGFLGGFTTFSTWMLDVVVLAESGHRGRRRAALNLAVTLIGFAGYALSWQRPRLGDGSVPGDTPILARSPARLVSIVRAKTGERQRLE